MNRVSMLLDAKTFRPSSNSTSLDADMLPPFRRAAAARPAQPQPQRPGIIPCAHRLRHSIAPDGLQVKGADCRRVVPVVWSSGGAQRWGPVMGTVVAVGLSAVVGACLSV